VFSGKIDIADHSYKSTYKEICDLIIHSSSEDIQKFLKNYLTVLFPKLSAIYGDIYQSGDFATLWRKQRRICSEDIFEIYFKFSLSNEEISQNDIAYLLSCGNNYDKLSIKLMDLNSHNKILSFLTIFPDYMDKIPKDKIELFVTALLDLGDLFPQNESFISETDMRIHFCIKNLLAKLDSQEDRFNVLRNSINSATRSLYTIVLEVAKFRRDLDDEKESVQKEKFVLNSDQLKELEDMSKNKIKIWVEKGRLDEYRDIRFILYQWKQWGADSEDINYLISKILENDSKLINFISDCISMSISSRVTDYVSKTHYSIAFSNVEEFMNLDEVEHRLKEISSSGVLEGRTEREKNAVKLFLDGVKNAKKSNNESH
jgi:hypothetical protein